jgi:hypothetical protein
VEAGGNDSSKAQDALNGTYCVVAFLVYLLGENDNCGVASVTNPLVAAHSYYWWGRRTFFPPTSSGNHLQNW